MVEGFGRRLVVEDNMPSRSDRPMADGRSERRATGNLTEKGVIQPDYYGLRIRSKASCRRQHALTFRSADGRSERRATGNLTEKGVIQLDHYG